jgi:isopentenyl diphosphate isomerase/L-lactate dehydrogenase-like FMN-dependent dehydrogenase
MGETRHAATRAETVMILFEKPDQPYDQIGIVSALGGYYTTDAQMYQKMQSKAANLGADAIIVRGDGATTVSSSNGGVTVIQNQTVRSAWEYPKTTAIAIKYR